MIIIITTKIVIKSMIEYWVWVLSIFTSYNYSDSAHYMTIDYIIDRDVRTYTIQGFILLRKVNFSKHTIKNHTTHTTILV